MKKDKWFKWKVGAVLTLGFAALFQTIRASGEYQAKITAAAAPASLQSAQAQQRHDPVIDEWLGQQGDSTGGTGDGSIRRHRSGLFQDPSGGSSGSGNSGFDSGTGRS